MEGVGIPPNIAAAIRRSQAARRAMRAQRRRAGIVVTALCLGTAVPVSLTFADSGGSDMLEAAVSKAQGLVDMLNQRSPGQRIAAQLTKTKHKQMALAKVRAPGPAAPDAHELAKILLGQPVLPVALAAAPIPPVDLVPPTLEAIVAPSPGNVIIIPPSGGGGGGVFPGGWRASGDQSHSAAARAGRSPAGSRAGDLDDHAARLRADRLVDPPLQSRPAATSCLALHF